MLPFIKGTLFIVYNANSEDIYSCIPGSPLDVINMRTKKSINISAAYSTLYILQTSKYIFYRHPSVKSVWSVKQNQICVRVLFCLKSCGFFFLLPSFLLSCFLAFLYLLDKEKISESFPDSSAHLAFFDIHYLFYTLRINLVHLCNLQSTFITVASESFYVFN